MSNFPYKSENPTFASTYMLYEDMCIHIIKGGHQNEFFVVYDDAHEEVSGVTKVMTHEEILDYYGIDINTDLQLNIHEEKEKKM